MMGIQYIVGVDDGYFPPYYKSRKGYTLLVAVKYDLLNRSVDAVAYTPVLVDGLDATIKAIELLRMVKGDLVLYDGVTYAGFNIIDPYRVYSELGIPGIVFYRHPLSLERIRNALLKHFPDHMVRLEIIARVLRQRFRMDSMWGIYEYTPIHIDPLEAREILRKLQYYSPEPEPLRIADTLASTTSRRLIQRIISERARRDLNPGPTG